MPEACPNKPPGLPVGGAVPGGKPTPEVCPNRPPGLLVGGAVDAGKPPIPEWPEPPRVEPKGPTAAGVVPMVTAPDDTGAAVLV